jgi:hypothetical protein
METRSNFSRRRTLNILASAASAAALATVAASRADAGLMIDVRIVGVSAGGTMLNPKLFATNGNTGFTVTLGVYGRVSGLNNVQNIGDLDGNGDAPDTQNDDSLNIVTGNFQSIGGLLGNMNSTGGQLNYNSRVVPFNGNGSQNGVAADWDSDGDLDIGALGTDPTNMFVIRANATTFAAVQNGTIKSWDSAGTFGANTDDTIINANASELRFGTIRFIVGANPNASVAINFVPRPTFDAGSALWFEDGIVTGKTPGTGSYTVGAPVNSFIPEPGAVAAVAPAGIAALGLLARRRNRSR